MKVKGENYRTIWQSSKDSEVIKIIDQRQLPHQFLILNLITYKDAIRAIKDMAVRGAPLIGGTAAWGMYLAALEAKKNNKGLIFLKNASKELISARPTAMNLIWAVDKVLSVVKGVTDLDLIVKRIEKEATDICDTDVKNCENIGNHGLKLIK